MTANITLHPAGEGEGLRLIRTATVQSKCEHSDVGWFKDHFGNKEPGAFTCHNGEFWRDTVYSIKDKIEYKYKPAICPRCKGEGTYPQTVRVDVGISAHPHYGDCEAWIIWGCPVLEIATPNLEGIIQTALRMYAAGEDVPGVTEVQDD